MKKTKNSLLTLFAVMLVFTACKKETVVKPQKEEILVSDLSAWTNEADLVVKTEKKLSEADYEKIKSAIGIVEVKFDISAGKTVSLPYSATKNDLVVTYYYKWEANKLTIYKQWNKVVAEIVSKPGDARLIFYTLK